ncbi:MAG: ATP-binding cassette domain-containing protein [Deltaproteobacteria bacterium]|nr:ATP-binding cassette domain-containing protein [Deltaproteobacteria bacterium]
MIRLEDIRVTLGCFSLDRVNLFVGRSECVVLLGPTGTGKTVLLETIAGIHRPNSGRLLINGEDMTRARPAKRGLGVVYQDYALFPHMTIFNNMGYGLKVRGISAKKIAMRVKDMAGFLEISHLLDRRPGRLSGGEQQRAALARALVTKPYALLLDEPLSALDKATRNRLRRELKRIHEELGISILHITHDLTDAFFLADRIAVMENGKILQADTPEKILSRPASRTVARLVGINNLIEGRMTSQGLETGIGILRVPAGEHLPAGFRAWAAIPDWAVHLFPYDKGNRYLWTDKMRITEINITDQMLRLRLANENGGTLQTRLSRREAAALPLSLEPGSSVPVGIHETGVSFLLS